MNTNEAISRHEGHNVKRLREILGIKQEALAMDIGVNQQKMSWYEQKQKLDDDIKELIAKALKVPVRAIENFDEQAAVNIITETFNNHDNASVYGHYTINPIDKWIEIVEENKKLYERLLDSEKQKVNLLEKLMEGRKN
jgi:transcriptional regulator with XRE-family HTH domain